MAHTFSVRIATSNELYGLNPQRSSYSRIRADLMWNYLSRTDIRPRQKANDFGNRNLQPDETSSSKIRPEPDLNQTWTSPVRALQDTSKSNVPKSQASPFTRRPERDLGETSSSTTRPMRDLDESCHILLKGTTWTRPFAGMKANLGESF